MCTNYESLHCAPFPTCLTLVSCLVYSLTVKMERLIPPKYRLNLNELNCDTFQKTEFLLTTAVRTPYPACYKTMLRKVIQEISINDYSCKSFRKFSFKIVRNV
jgi:hypothetical protein